MGLAAEERRVDRQPPGVRPLRRPGSLILSELLWRRDALLLELVTQLGVPVERVQAGAYVLTLSGERRRSTPVWLLAGEQAVVVEAFVMHVVADACPDPAPLHSALLRHNLKLRGVHFALDDIGDLFLVGSLPIEAVDEDNLDRLLGELLDLLDASSETLIALAYGDRLAYDPALAAKARFDGAGRRPAGTWLSAPRRDSRR